MTERDDMVAELQALREQLSPSPCGVAGHRRCDWDDTHSPRLDHPESETERLLCCKACQREQTVAQAERERCAKAAFEFSEERIELAAVTGARIANVIRSLGPTLALTEFERRVRREECEWWIKRPIRNHDFSEECRCETCQHYAALKGGPHEPNV